MKKLFSLLALCGLGLFALGCEPAADSTTVTPADGDGAVVETTGDAEVTTDNGTTVETESGDAKVTTPDGTTVETEGSATVTEGAAPESTDPAPAPEGSETPAEDKPADEKAPE